MNLSSSSLSNFFRTHATATAVMIAAAAMVLPTSAGAADGHDAPSTPPHAKTAMPPHANKVMSAATGSAAPATHGAVHWSYAGKAGPDRWGDLKADYHPCKKGTAQSPVNLADETPARMPEIVFNYSLSPLVIRNNGHTVQVDMPEGSSITVAGKTYALVQFHFHTPSEHAVSAQRHPLEMHLVHKNAHGQLAVVGVFVKPGKTHIGVAEIWYHLPAKSGQVRKAASVAINPHDLLPADKHYYRYMGSLTTPPCSEGVNWFVLKTPVEASDKQIDAIRRIMGENARPLQPVGNRLVVGGE